jgi:hypothetical protein
LGNIEMSEKHNEQAARLLPCTKYCELDGEHNIRCPVRHRPAVAELLDQIYEKIAAKSSILSHGSTRALGIMLYDVQVIIQAQRSQHMTDYEVGELWNIVQANDWHIKRLIRKLVEERATHYSIMRGSLGLEFALRDFGISPESWK